MNNLNNSWKIYEQDINKQWQSHKQIKTSIKQVLYMSLTVHEQVMSKAGKSHKPDKQTMNK